MKKNPFVGLIALLGAIAAASAIAADSHSKLRVLAQGGAPDTKPERRVFVRHAEPAEMESVAFLGVETVPVMPALTAQLGLPKGTGLVVRHLVPDSPASAVLQVHDVLLKLDDQWLIAPRQFSVLVRNHKEGDEVEVTYVRGGKQATAKVKLSKHDVPKLAALDEGDESFRVLLGDDDLSTGRPEEMKHVLSLLDGEAPKTGERVRHITLPAPPGPGFRALTVNPGNSNMVFNDDRGSLELTIKDGQKTLVAKNAKGEPVYSGPLDTPEQRQALPAEVRERLDRIERLQGFSFELGENFKDNVKFVRPEPTKISLPFSPATAPELMEAPPPAI